MHCTRPRTAVPLVLALALTLVLAVSAVVAPTAPAGAAAAVACGDPVPETLATAPAPAWVDRLNQRRVAAGLRAVAYAPLLDDFAAVHVAELLAHPEAYPDPHAACAGARHSNVIAGAPDLVEAVDVLGAVPAHAAWLMAPGLAVVGGAAGAHGPSILYGGYGGPFSLPDHQWPTGTYELRRMPGHESPDPLTNCPGLAQRDVGTPLWARFPTDPGAVVSTVLTDLTAGVVVPTCSFIWSGVTPYTITLLPRQPLQAGHAYAVSAASRDAGTRSWSFTIAPRPVSVELRVQPQRGGTASVTVAVDDTSRANQLDGGGGPAGTAVLGTWADGACTAISTRVLDGSDQMSPSLVNQTVPLRRPTTYCASFSGVGVVGGTVVADRVSVVPQDVDAGSGAGPHVSPHGQVDVGTLVTVSGRLDVADRTRVALEQQAPDGRWGRVATGVARDGFYALVFTLVRSGPLRVRTLGDPSAVQVATATLTARATVTGFGRTGASARGRTVRFRVSVRPEAARAVSLQQLVGGTWRVIASVAARSGRATLPFRPRTRGVYRLRVLVAGSADVAAGTSGIRVHRVR